MQLRSRIAVAVVQTGSNSTLSLGNSICCRCSPKKEKKKTIQYILHMCYSCYTVYVIEYLFYYYILFIYYSIYYTHYIIIPSKLQYTVYVNNILDSMQYICIYYVHIVCIYYIMCYISIVESFLYISLCYMVHIKYIKQYIYIVCVCVYIYIQYYIYVIYFLFGLQKFISFPPSFLSNSG